MWQTHVVPVTSNVDRAGLAGTVFLPAAMTRLERDSVAVPLGLELVEREWLVEPAGRLPLDLMRAIDDGIRLVLGL